MWGLMDFLVNSSALLLLCFTGLSYACGLFYLAELAEEYPTLTGKILRALIGILLFVHICLLIAGYPIFNCLLGFACHATYYYLIRNFPHILVHSTEFFVACVGVILSQIAWLYHFRYTSAATHQGGLFRSSYSSYDYHRSAYVTSTSDLLSFCLICIWLVPLCLFISGCTSQDSIPHHTTSTSSLSATTLDSTGKSRSNKSAASASASARARAGPSRRMAFFAFLKSKLSGTPTLPYDHIDVDHDSFHHHSTSSSWNPPTPSNENGSYRLQKQEGAVPEFPLPSSSSFGYQHLKPSLIAGHDHLPHHASPLRETPALLPLPPPPPFPPPQDMTPQPRPSATLQQRYPKQRAD